MFFYREYIGRLCHHWIFHIKLISTTKQFSFQFNAISAPRNICFQSIYYVYWASTNWDGTRKLNRQFDINTWWNFWDWFVDLQRVIAYSNQRKDNTFPSARGGGVLRMNLSNYTSSIKFSWNNKNNNNSIEADRRDLLMSSVSLIDLFSFPLSVGICYFFFVCVFISLLRNQQTKSMESMAVWLFTFPIFTPFTLIYSRYHTSFSKWLTIEKRIIYDFIGPFVIYNLRKTVFLIFGK